MSNFKPVMLFGLLVALTMVTTTFGALVLLPAVIKATEVSLEKSKSNSIFWKIFYIGRYFDIDENEEREN